MMSTSESTSACSALTDSKNASVPAETSATWDGTPNPTYRCLFPGPPPDGMLPTCAEAGVLGALTGVIGTMMAMEAIKEICGVGTGLVGRLLLYDARDARFETLAYRWSPDNPLTGDAPTITDLSIHTAPSPVAAET